MAAFLCHMKCQSAWTATSFLLLLLTTPNGELWRSKAKSQIATAQRKLRKCCSNCSGSGGQKQEHYGLWCWKIGIYLIRIWPKCWICHPPRLGLPLAFPRLLSLCPKVHTKCPPPALLNPLSWSPSASAVLYFHSAAEAESSLHGYILVPSALTSKSLQTWLTLCLQLSQTGTGDLSQPKEYSGLHSKPVLPPEQLLPFYFVCIVPNSNSYTPKLMSSVCYVDKKPLTSTFSSPSPLFSLPWHSACEEASRSDSAEASFSGMSSPSDSPSSSSSSSSSSTSWMVGVTFEGGTEVFFGFLFFFFFFFLSEPDSLFWDLWGRGRWVERGWWIWWDVWRWTEKRKRRINVSWREGRKAYFRIPPTWAEGREKINPHTPLI